jgi:hypothetical protein
MGVSERKVLPCGIDGVMEVGVLEGGTLTLVAIWHICGGFRKEGDVLVVVNCT